METYTELISRIYSNPNYRERLQKATNSGDHEELGWLVEKVSQSHQAEIIDGFIHLTGEGRGVYKEISGYLRTFGVSAEDIEDIMTDTQLKVWEKRNRFELSRNARPWLYRIATNQCLDFKRRNKRHKWASLDQLNSTKVGDEDEECSLGDILESRYERTAEDNESSEIVRRGLSMLPENSRQVIELVYFQGLKYKEAAEVLGIPVGTVKSRIHGAIGNLGKSSLIQKLNEAA